MHPSSVQNMKVARAKFLQYLSALPSPKVLDVGGLHHVPHKSYLRLFEDIVGIEWFVADIKAHSSVTHVMPGPYTLPFEDNTFDLVVSGQMLEHCSNPFKSIAEMKRVLRPGCRMVLIAPSAGPYHDVQDCWRFQKDAWKVIMEDIGGMQTIAQWISDKAPDERSRKWQDNVFVGQKM